MKKAEFIQCVALQLGRKGVRMTDRFQEDLGAESMDMVHLALVVEEQTGRFLPVESLPELNSVEDMYNYILSEEY